MLYISIVFYTFSFFEETDKKDKNNIGLLKKYSSKEIIVFHSRAESEEYLSSLKKNCI